METIKYSFRKLLSKIVDNRGKTCPTSEEGFPLIATNCIKNETLYPVFEKIRFVNDETRKNWFRGHPKPDDIIFVCKGSPGRVAWTPEPVNFCIAQDMLAIRADEKLVDSRFLFALLRQKKTQTQIENMHVGTLIPHFKKGDFNSLILELPKDKALQKAIGKIYFDFSEKIALNRKMNQTLESMAQALFKSWFVDFDPVLDNALAAGHEIPEALKAKAEKRQQQETRNKELNKLFPSSFEFNETLDKWIPEGWVVKTIGDITEHKKGFAFKSKWYQGDGRMVVRVSDTTESSIDIKSCNCIPIEKAKELEQYALKTNDIVIATVGSWPQNMASVVGKVIRVPILANNALLNQNAVRLRIKDNLAFSQGLLYYQLKNQSFIGFIINRAQGSASQASITLSSIFDFPILVPNDELLKLLSNYIDTQLAKQNELLKEENSLTQLRDTLLPKLISGKVRLAEGFVDGFKE